MTECNEAVRQLWDYVEGDIEPGEGARIEEHLDLCRQCCGEMEFAEEMRRFMARRPTVDIPAGVLARFESLIDDPEGHGLS